MTTTDVAAVCKNCSQPVSNKYCSFCGQKTSTVRFSSGLLFHDLLHGVFHIDRGMFFTARELLLRPGKMLNEYLGGHRVRYFNPFTFCLIIGGINSVLLQKIHWSGLFVDLELISRQDFHQETWNMSLKFFAYRLLLSVPVFSLVTFIFYHNRPFNFIEHLIANTYLRGEFCLIMIFLLPFEFLISSHAVVIVIRLIFVVGALVYLGWSFAQLFGKAPVKKTAVAKGFLAALAAIILEMLLMNGVARLF